MVKFRYGRFGSGKTSSTIYDCIKDVVIEQRRIISNMKSIQLPETVTINPMDIIGALRPDTKEEEEAQNYVISKLKNKETLLSDSQIKSILNDKQPKTMFLDEIGKWWDSRNHGSQLNRFLGYFIDQTRKRNMNVYVTDQHVSGYDLRGRQVTDKLIRCVGQYYPDNLKDSEGRKIPYRFHFWETDVEWETTKYYWFSSDLMSVLYPFYDSYEKILPAEMILESMT